MDIAALTWKKGG